MSFEEFLLARVEPRFHPLARAVRDLMARVAPDARQGMRGGTDAYIPVPVWRMRRDMVVMSPSKTALTISFVRGAGFVDRHGLLGGAGKTSRTVRLTGMEAFDAEALSDYIRQAVEIDRAPREPGGHVAVASA